MQCTKGSRYECVLPSDNVVLSKVLDLAIRIIHDSDRLSLNLTRDHQPADSQILVGSAHQLSWTYVASSDVRDLSRYADFLAVILGLALTGAVTETVKLTVGRPRPGISLLPWSSDLI